LKQRLAICLLALLLAGCSGITSYEHRNQREEGPTGGLLTGPDGQWTLGIDTTAPTSQNR